MKSLRSRFASSPWRRFWGWTAVAVAVWVVGALAAGALAPRLPAGSAGAAALAGWRESIRDGALILLAFAAVVPAFAALVRGSGLDLVPSASPRSLGAIRAWIAAILLASVLWEDLPSSAYLPRGMLDLDRHWLVGFLHGLPIGFDHFLASYAGLLAFEGATILLLGLAIAGAFTRWTVPAAALAYLLYASILRSYAWSYHMGLVPLLVLFLLSFTPCGDALSLDRWRRVRSGAAVPPADVPTRAHGMGRYLVWMGVAIPYVMAGLSKLRNTGFSWWRGEHMRQMVLATIVEPMHFQFDLAFRMLRGPVWLFDVLGIVALVTEVTFGLVLLHRLARLVLPAVMAATHVGILLLQNILFPDLIAIQAVFYDWSPLARRVAGWRPGGVASVPGEGAPRRDLAPALRLQSRVAAVFLATTFLVWATRTEKFPLTAMQMFSRPVPLEPLEYVRPLVYYADGSSEQARFERWIGAVSDTRYRRLIRDWSPERVGLLHEFLDAAAARANANAPPDRRVRGFRLELRRWDFRRYPADPERGRLERVLLHEVGGRTLSNR